MYKDAILAMVQKINPRELEERLLTYIDAGDREYLKHHQELKLKERMQSYILSGKKQQD